MAEAALIIDMRPELARKKRPLTSDLQLSFLDLETDVAALDKSVHYLLVCEFGPRSQSVAKELHNRGFKVYSISYAEYLKKVNASSQ